MRCWRPCALLQAAKSEESAVEPYRAKLRAAVKRGKAIEKQRGDLEMQLLSLREQVLFWFPYWHVCEGSYADVLRCKL